MWRLLLRAPASQEPSFDIETARASGAAAEFGLPEVRERLDHEHALMNARVGQLVTLDALLATALSLVWSTNTTHVSWLLLPALFGLVVSLSYWYAIEVASLSMEQYRLYAARVIGIDPDERGTADPTFRILVGQPVTPLHGVSTFTRRWLQPHRAVPTASTFAWGALGVAVAFASLV